jgi:hypothetical protein
MSRSVASVVLALCLGCTARNSPVVEQSEEAKKTVAGSERDVEEGRASITPRTIVAVGTVQELVAAAAPDRIIFLLPGEYVLPEERIEALEGSSRLLLIGLGTPPPKIKREGSDESWVLTLEGVEDVGLYNLALEHEAVSPETEGGVLRVLSSRDVRLVELDIGGDTSTTFALHGVEDVLVRRSWVSGCHSRFAMIAESKNVEIDEVVFRGEFRRPGCQIVVQSSTVEISRSHVWNSSSPQSSLFVVDPPDAIAGTIRKGRAWGRGAHAGSSDVRLRDAVFGQSSYAALVDRPDGIAVANTIVYEKQFASDAAFRSNERACSCHRLRTSLGFETVSSCWPTLDQCQAEAKRIVEGPASPALAASVTRECATVYGSDEKLDGGWDAFFAEHEHSVRVGVCSTAGPPSPPPPPVSSPEATDDDRWNALETWGVFIHDRKLNVVTEVVTKKFDRQAERLESVRLAAHDPRIPPEVARLARPYVASTEGISRTAERLAVELVSTPYDGAWWFVEFPQGSFETPAIALSKAFDPGLRLAPATQSLEVRSDHPLVKRAAEMLPPRWIAEYALFSGEEVERTIQTLPGRFPGGATQVIAVSWGVVNAEDVPMTLVFTATPEGEIVQVLSAIGTYWSSSADLEFSADLDGDGFDEVGWKSGGYEDSASHVTHLVDRLVQHRLLFASGL